MYESVINSYLENHLYDNSLYKGCSVLSDNDILTLRVYLNTEEDITLEDYNQLFDVIKDLSDETIIPYPYLMQSVGPVNNSLVYVLSMDSPYDNSFMNNLLYY